MASLAAILAGIFLLLAVYCGVDPFHYSAISGFTEYDPHPVDLPPRSSVPPARDPENRLQRSEIRFAGQLHGPESIVFDPLGHGPYTGLADGQIVFYNGDSWSEFAVTSPNRSELCDPNNPSPLRHAPHGPVCGRPLGLQFNKKNGYLYIADAYFGLLRVGPEGGLAETLSTEAEGVPFKLANGLDVDDDGNVYFTDSSAKYQLRNFMQLFFSSDPTGRLLKYNPVTKETTVLLRNLQFPNGVALSKDRSFLVLCEGSRGRLTKYWLKGEKVGTTEDFAVLPGFPDNIRINEKGEFWVAINYRRSLYAHYIGLYPRLRKFLLSLPIPVNYHYIMTIGGKLHALVMKFGPNGELLQVLEDSEGRVVRAVSEVEEKDGKLWIGSVLMSFIAVY